MKKTQIALAAVALVASSAALAEVTVSGRIDAGVQSGNSASFSQRLGSGMLAPNFLNFSGSEDLGSGMKAIWMGRTAFSAAGFNSSTTGNSVTFLESYVGLSGDFGTLKLGQQFDAFGLGVLGFDVSGGSNMGSAVTPLFAHKNSAIFTDNAIGYAAPAIGPINASATYIVNDSAGTATGMTPKKGDYSLFGTADLGMVKLGAGYAVLNTNKSVAVTAGSDLGFGQLNLIYMDSNNVAGSNSGDKASTTGINGKAPLVGGLALAAGYYSTNGSVINGTNTIATLLYSLSKQTTVFGNYEKATGAVILNAGGAAGGTTGEVVSLGVAHSF